MNDLWQDSRGTVYEVEATTNGGIYGWFRNVETDESVRLKWATLKPVNGGAL